METAILLQHNNNFLEERVELDGIGMVVKNKRNQVFFIEFLFAWFKCKFEYILMILWIGFLLKLSKCYVCKWLYRKKRNLEETK